MDKFNDVEYKAIPKDEECITTAVKIGDAIGEPASRIRKWAEYHEDNLYIKKINGRFSYTEKSIKQFEFIKDLKQNKGMTHEQIKQYMKKHGTECEKFSSGIINPNDPFGYEVLSSAIAQETENKLKEFMSIFVQYQEKNNTQLINVIKSDIVQIEQTIDDRLKLSGENIIKELEEQKEANQKLLEQLNEVKEELALTKNASMKVEEQLQDNFDNMSEKIIDENRKELEKLKNEIKYVSPEEINNYQEKNKSWFSKIFNKK